MKAKKGGNINEATLKRLFADDIAMQRLLSDCNKEEVLSFFKDSPTLSGGAKGQKRGREEEDEDEMLAALEEMEPAKTIKRQRKDELVFPDKCSMVQRAIAIFASATIELMYKGATTAAACYYFPEQMSSLSNIMSGFISVIRQNIGGQGTVAIVSAITTLLYTYQKDGKMYDLINNIFSYAKMPIPGNSIYSIIKRAITFCEYDLVPLGRGVTVDSIKQGFWNKLGDIGLGPVGEARRMQRQSELAELAMKYKAQGIPQPPRLGMPSRPIMPRPTLQDILREVPRVQEVLKSDLSDSDKLINARNMLDKVREEIRATVSRKERLDRDIENLETDETVPENAALMQQLEDSKVMRKENMDNLVQLREKEEELLANVNRLEMLPGAIERARERVMTAQQLLPSAPALPLEEEMSLEVEERPKTKKKRRDAEGGKRRTHRKKHVKKSKKYNGGKNHKKSSKRHHKKTHKKH